MPGSRNRLAWFRRTCVFASFIVALMLAGRRPSIAQTVPPAAGPQDAAIEDYSHHIANLLSLVDACARLRDRQACDPALVGPDDRVVQGPEHRAVHYQWLRSLLLQAQIKDNAVSRPGSAETNFGSAGTRASVPATSQLLQAAHQRLVADLAQATRPLEPAPAHVRERDILKRVLAEDAFRGLNASSRRESQLEKLNQWLNALFARADALRPRSPWFGRLLVWGFILGTCLVLLWRLIQLERSSRLRLVPETSAPADDAASTRGWQRWLDDARRAAAAGQWREAVHRMYWAAIVRLESRRLWPVDRARTPREYLALLAADDPRKERLAALSINFEHIWYGGQTAEEADYRRAEQQALALIKGEAR